MIQCNKRRTTTKRHTLWSGTIRLGNTFNSKSQIKLLRNNYILLKFLPLNNFVLIRIFFARVCINMYNARTQPIVRIGCVERFYKECSYFGIFFISSTQHFICTCNMFEFSSFGSKLNEMRYAYGLYGMGGNSVKQFRHTINDTHTKFP